MNENIVPIKTKEYVTSWASDDLGIVDMVLDPATNNPRFLQWQNGQTSFHDVLKLNDGREIFPLHSTDPLITHNFVHLPSEAAEYGTERELFERVREHVSAYVSLTPSFNTVASLYVLMTWLYDVFTVLPYLRVIGTFGTGKTRFLEVIGKVSYKGSIAGGSITGPALYRTIDRVRGTFVFDEANFRSSDTWTDMIKILNAGNSQGFPVVRMEPQKDGKYKTIVFDAFGPKIIASRERFDDDALESRCLTQYMLPRKKISVPLHLDAEFKSKALSLRNQLLMFRFRNRSEVDINRVKVDSVELPRLKQSLLPLVYVAQLVDDALLVDIEKFAREFEADLIQNQIAMPEADVLLCLARLSRTRADAKGKKGRVHMKDVADEFNRLFADDYSSSGKLSSQGYIDLTQRSFAERVSARLMGAIVSKRLHVRKMRDSEGFYVPMTERAKIDALVQRYGITEEMLKGDDSEEGSDEVKDVTTTLTS